MKEKNTSQTQHCDRSGLTIVELLLVVGVIGVIASVVIAAIGPSRQFIKAHDTERKSNVNALIKAMNNYHWKNGSMLQASVIPSGLANSKPICKQGSPNGLCIDLDALVPDFLAEIPDEGICTKHTGYKVYQEGGRALVHAPFLEIAQIAITVQQCNLAALITSGLIGYWPFDEGSGISAGDASGNGYNGVLTNMVAGDWTATTAPVTYTNPYALNFDGVNNFVDMTATGLKALTYNEFSIAFWYKSTGNNVASSDEHAFSMYANGNTDRIIAGPANDSGHSDELLFFTQRKPPSGPALSDSIYGDAPSTDVANQAWHHLTVVRGGGWKRVYVDGVMRGERLADPTAGSLRPDKDGPIIGATYKGSGNPSSLVNGILDEVRLYNRVLTPQEIQIIAAGNG